jgi:hypothetical protein
MLPGNDLFLVMLLPLLLQHPDKDFLNRRLLVEAEQSHRAQLLLSVPLQPVRVLPAACYSHAVCLSVCLSVCLLLA